MRRRGHRLPDFEDPAVSDRETTDELEYALTLNASMDYGDAIAMFLRFAGEQHHKVATGRHLPADLHFRDDTDWFQAAVALAQCVDKELARTATGVIELVDPPVLYTIMDVLASLAERASMMEAVDFEDTLTESASKTGGPSGEVTETLVIRWKRPT